MKAELAAEDQATVMVIDDDVFVLEVAVILLKRLGYSVVSAESGQTALEILSADNRAIDLVLMDFCMPGLSGVELAEKIRGRLPGIKIVLSSGYNRDMAEADRITNHFIQKPYTLSSLAANLEQALRS
jgi:CheY-like chemotaxis protein